MLIFKKGEEEQKKLSKRVVSKDEFSDPSLLCGVEAISVGRRVVACAALIDAKTYEVIETAVSDIQSPIPFHPEFRALREGPAMGDAISKLSKRPDVLFVLGEGKMHPRFFGVACHLGVLLDMPTIGVSKEMLCGEEKGDKILLNLETIGQKVRTKEHANPLIVSIGNKISLQSACSLVRKSTIEPHKMPEPLHYAHKYVKKAFSKKEQDGDATLHP